MVDAPADQASPGAQKTRPVHYADTYDEVCQHPQSPDSPGPTRTPPDAGEGRETATEERSWWRRLFGGQE